MQKRTPLTLFCGFPSEVQYAVKELKGMLCFLGEGTVKQIENLEVLGANMDIDLRLIYHNASSISMSNAALMC